MTSSDSAAVSLRPPTLLALPSYLAGTVAGLGNRRLIALLKREGLALQQYAVLVALADFGILAPHELARRLGTDRSHISAYVEALTRLGFALRTPDTQDRRRVSVDLTPEGRDVVERMSTAAAESQRGFLTSLAPDEQATLRALLLKVIVADERTERPIVERPTTERPAANLTIRREPDVRIHTE